MTQDARGRAYGDHNLVGRTRVRHRDVQRIQVFESQPSVRWAGQRANKWLGSGATGPTQEPVGSTRPESKRTMSEGPHGCAHPHRRPDANAWKLKIVGLRRVGAERCRIGPRHEDSEPLVIEWIVDPVFGQHEDRVAGLYASAVPFNAQPGRSPRACNPESLGCSEPDRVRPPGHEVAPLPTHAGEVGNEDIEAATKGLTLPYLLSLNCEGALVEEEHLVQDQKHERADDRRDHQFNQREASARRGASDR